jgi:rhodanese-related sulfurtransferase
MSADQIILYAVLALAGGWYLRRSMLARTVARYTAAEVAGRLKGPAAPLLLDVRTAAERSGSSIPGSLHIPLHELGRRVDELKKHKDREIVVYCASGSRSVSAALKLKKEGFNAANLTGGIAEWKLSQRS